ncbi:hypothetical protein [Streptomyces roseirectus]|uniref:hypothetical protein n=1 Tax=Streptomyces roseirectus TaxID=2768066 RepID=UPI001FE81BA1|nr:hypothetical protein [Streptomyces roseirectus]
MALLLGPAVFFGPHLLAADGSSQSGFGDQGVLIGAVKKGFVEYWGAGSADYSPAMGSVVDYWFRFHVAKAVISSAWLVVLVALGVVVWRGFVRGDGVRRAWLAVAGAGITVGGLFSLVVALANVQGAVAPFTSALTMLPVGQRGGALGGTLAQVREGLAGDPASAPPALGVMIDDNVRYHVTMAVVAGVATLAFVVVSVVLWRRFAGTGDRRARTVLAGFGALCVVLALAMAVVGVANVSVAEHSARGLSDFFQA